jgi:hypothetical protein
MTYVDDLAAAIGRTHGCKAHLEEFVPVTATRLGGVAWEGDVGIFLLDGHPKARRCYAWGYPSDDEASSRDIITVLELPPVVSAETAVRSALESRGHAGTAMG